MKRYGVVLALALALAVVVGILARRPSRPRAATNVVQAAPAVALAVTFDGRSARPGVASVPANHRVALTLVNGSPRAMRVTLAGYEDRLDSGPLAPGARWSESFLADRPGEAFAWLVDGEPCGRLEVRGSHLVEGHR